MSLDGDLNLTGMGLDPNRDGTVERRVPKSVRQEVHEHALDLGGREPRGHAADGPVTTFSQDVTLGLYRGQVVTYLDFGPVRLRAGNKVAPIWAFTNGDEASAT